MSLHDTLSRLTGDKILPELIKIVERAHAGHSIFRGRHVTIPETGDSVSLDFLAQTFFRSNLFQPVHTGLGYIFKPCNATLEERCDGLKLRQKIADLYAHANEMLSASSYCTSGVFLLQDYFIQPPEALARAAILNWDAVQSLESLENNEPISKKNELLGFSQAQFETYWPGRKPIFTHSKVTSTMCGKIIERHVTEFYFASEEMLGLL